jgi:hypothetical protein
MAHTDYGAHPAYPVGIRGLSQGLKRPLREADQLPVTMNWSALRRIIAASSK